MRMTPILGCESEEQKVRIRALKREHMRRWRAIPGNREYERAQQRQSLLERKLRMLKSGRWPVLCGFCYQRPANGQVERLMPVPRGFRRIFVPYCGVC